MPSERAEQNRFREKVIGVQLKVGDGFVHVTDVL